MATLFVEHSFNAKFLVHIRRIHLRTDRVNLVGGQVDQVYFETVSADDVRESRFIEETNLD